MTVVDNSIVTMARRVAAANDQYTDWTSSNTYVSIGVESPYAANDSLVPIPNNSMDYLNGVFLNMIALKLITAADMAFVVPRIDWQTGVVYSQWDDTVDMYATANLIALSGTVNVSNSRTVTGTNTAFLSQLTDGELLYLPGDGETVAPQTLQVTDIFSNTSLNVNTAFSGNFISNTASLVSNSAPDYTNNFYVRNAYDQVFECLFNNGGVTSTVMPTISLGGNLPESAFIETSDGYQWKYLYTIPAGQKESFFSTDWMPVFSEADVVEAAVDGRIDVVLLNAGGTGYNQNVQSQSATILTVVGDGTGANLTAVIAANGVISGINILNGGQGYTNAYITISGGGSGANLRVLIGPPGGHGFNPISELGASSLMLSVDLQGTENDTIPTGASVGDGVFEYRQVGVLQNPLLAGSGDVASNSNYSTISTVTVQAPGGGLFFNIDEIVYQGSSLANNTFSGTVVYWDDVNNILWLNNMTGTFLPQAPIVGTIQTSPVTAFVLTPSVIDLYSGDLLFINNALPVTRGPNQMEQIRAVFQY